MTSHENKLFILNNNHYWHLCDFQYGIYNNAYYIENNYFKCKFRDCKFRFPTILGPDRFLYSMLHNGIKIVELGPPYAIFWAHIEQHKPGYIELDISQFQDETLYLR